MGRQRIHLGLLALAVACAGEPEDSGQLPPEDTDNRPVDTDTAPFPEDTSPVDLDEEPANTLLVREWGTWSLTPIGGPYSTLIGTLEVREWVDGEIPDTADPDAELPACRVTYALQGEPPPAGGCAGCAFTFFVTFTRVDGDPEPCHDPDLPLDGEVRALGFHATEGRIYWNYGGLGLWYPWYTAQQVGDQVTFLWEDTFGVSLPEDM